MNNMENRQQVINAFREARIVGEKLLNQGKLTWDEFAFTMVGYELQLKSMGVNLCPLVFRVITSMKKPISKLKYSWRSELKRNITKGGIASPKHSRR
jgi:hypothetical protein